MTLIRRAILAIALIAGLAPAIAQVPPPVPALPDSERRTSYSISASTCACSVGFALYGDSTDYQNWVEVWVNGVRVSNTDPTFGWAITSPTGPLASISRPVTDGVLTFTTAQTGTIQIVGARRPRRLSTFSENRGVAARDLNQILNDMIAQTRELWDKTNTVTGRAILGLPGESIANLPSASARASSFICWDATGLIPMACGPLNGQGNVVGPNSAIDGHIAVFSGTTGRIVRDGGLIGVGNVTGPGSATDGAFALYNGTTGALLKNGPTLIPLANGGLNANNTASAGGIFWSDASKGNILAGTATALQMLQSGANVTPAWSIATWPATTTANQLLWSSGTNSVAGLATASNGVLITSGAGVPSISATLPAAVQGNITTVGTISSGAWNGAAIGVTFGGTGCTSAGGSCLDSITGFASNGYVRRTGAGTYTLNSPIPMADGGSNASLTASNGGLVYSTGSAMAILNGTGSANQIPLSGINSAPAWSTTTWPNTISANNLLWSAGSNAVSGLATANNGVLATSAIGVPSITSTLPTAVQSNITQIGTISAGVWNGTAITGSFIGTNTVTNSNLTQASLGAMLKGNPTSSGANLQDFTIQGLTNKSSPSANNDFLLLYDASSGSFKSVTPGQLASGGTAGVSSLNGLTGGLSIAQGAGITVSAAGSSVTVSAALPRAYLSGYGLSNDLSSPNTVIDVAAGTCRDSTNAQNITIGSAFTKTTGSWAVGTGNGGLDTGSVANNTSYFPFAILRTDLASADILLSASPSAPTLPANYSFFCRLGAFKTSAASTNIRAFSQLGNVFYWATDDGGSSAFFNSTVGTSATSLTATVPIGIKVEAIIRAQMTATGSLTNVLFSPLDQTDQSPSAAVNFSADSSNHSTIELRIRTNTSGQFRARSNNAATAIYATTAGWVDSTLGF